MLPLHQYSMCRIRSGGRRCFPVLHSSPAGMHYIVRTRAFPISHVSPARFELAPRRLQVCECYQLHHRETQRTSAIRLVDHPGFTRHSANILAGKGRFVDPAVSELWRRTVGTMPGLRTPCRGVFITLSASVSAWPYGEGPGNLFSFFCCIVLRGIDRKAREAWKLE